MLTIKKIENIQEAEAYLTKHSLSHDIKDEQVMGVYTDDGLIGLGSLCLCGYKVYLNFIHLAEEDSTLCHGLAKSLLNMADLRGIKTVYGNNPVLDKLYTRLRFQKENEEYVLSLENYFQAEHN